MTLNELGGLVFCRHLPRLRKIQRRLALCLRHLCLRTAQLPLGMLPPLLRPPNSWRIASTFFVIE
jgi:hypothetical protein